jgi:hypothetical protein
MTAQFGPHRFSAGEYDAQHTDALRGQELVVRDLTGTRFVDCDLSQVKIVDSFLVDVSVSGYVSNLVVNGVDVTEFVDAELDRRHPERVQLREIRSVEGFQSMWDTIEQLWSRTTLQVEQLPETARQERVDDEWSFVETLRHLVFITDAWVSRTVLDDLAPYAALGLPQTWYPSGDAEALGIDLAARPSYDQVKALRAERMAVVRGVVDALSDSELGRTCERTPAPGYPEEARPVAGCLWVTMQEECEHYRYATRDLAVLTKA